MNRDDEIGLIELLEEQIRATNRVNHAVRAIVIPSTIVLIAFLIAIPFLVIGLVVGEPTVLFLAGAILLIGGVMAIVSQINESALSDMPSRAAFSAELDGQFAEAQPSGEVAEDPNLKQCSFCGAKFPRARMACTDCGMS